MDRLLSPNEHHLYIVEILASRMRRSEPRGVELDGKTRCDELERAHLVGKIARPPRSGRRRADECATADLRDTSPAFSSWSSARGTVLRAA